ncbi:GNAT family N-acetyltransferase [Sandaracinobacter neustonicus]|nr:N-acetyltransferase [Sandaracinobacter neustonicus]
MDVAVDYLSHDSVAPERVAELLDLCFGPARQKRTASLLRADAPRIERASFVAVDGDELVGSVECWELEWRHPMGVRRIALLGPLVSHPGRRGERIGVRLMDLALAELDAQHLPVMLIGDEPYYGRWGFSARHTGEWLLPGPVDRDRLLLRTRAGHRLRGPAQICAAANSSSAAA